MNIFGIILLLVASIMPAEAYRFDGNTTFIKNYDGDTITVNVEIWPGIYKVDGMRLYGVDTPEIRGKCREEKELAIKAKNYVTQRLTMASKLEVLVVGEGKYGRPLIILFVDGEDISEELIIKGYAKPYDGEKRQDWCDET